MWDLRYWLASIALLTTCDTTPSVVARRVRDDRLATSLVALTGEHREAGPFAYDDVAEIPRDWRTLPSAAVVMARDRQSHVAVNDYFVLGLDDRVLTAWRSEDGAALWMRSSPHRTGVVLSGELAVLTEPTDVTVIATATGENVWSYALDPAAAERVSSVAIQGDAVEIILHGADETDRVEWRSLQDGSATSAPAAPPSSGATATGRADAARAMGLVEVVANESVALGFRGRELVILDGATDTERGIEVGPELYACLRSPAARAMDAARLFVACSSPNVLVDIDLTSGRVRSLRTGVGAIADLTLAGPFAVLHRRRSTIIVDLRLDGGRQREHLRREDDVEHALEVMGEYGARPADAPWLYPQTPSEAAEWFVRLDETGEATERALRELDLERAAQLMRAVNERRRPPNRVGLALLHRTYGPPSPAAVSARVAALAALHAPLELEDADRLATETIAWMNRSGPPAFSTSKFMVTYLRDEAPRELISSAVLAGRNTLLRLSRSRAPLDRIAQVVALGLPSADCTPSERDDILAAVVRWHAELRVGGPRIETAVEAGCVIVPTLFGIVRVEGTDERYAPPCDIAPTSGSDTAFPEARTVRVPSACVASTFGVSAWQVQSIDGLWRVVGEID